MAIKKGTEIATIDVSLVTLKPETGDEIAIVTATQVSVEPQIETVDPVKLVIKGRLIAQKGEEKTITGHVITLTDNVFTPEIAKIVQGGTIVYNSQDATKVDSYTPPVAGSGEKGEDFDLCFYTAQYNAAGDIVKYEKTTYPNGKGSPFGVGAQDGVFRVSSYTINSAPDTGEAPYKIEYIDDLPVIP